MGVINDMLSNVSVVDAQLWNLLLVVASPGFIHPCELKQD